VVALRPGCFPAEPRPAFPLFSPRSITMFKPLVRWARPTSHQYNLHGRDGVCFPGRIFARPLFGQTPAASAPPRRRGGFKFFTLFTDPKYTSLERGALLSVLAIAIIGLL